MRGRPIKVLVVDDSPLARALIRRVLSEGVGFEVSVAGSGEQALRAEEETRPDVILMDLVMGGMGGARATREIMVRTPTPILVLTGSFQDSPEVLEALEAGAVDVAEKPRMDRPDDWAVAGGGLVEKVRSLARASHIPSPQANVPAPQAPAPASGKTRVVLVGASTGGPRALMTILKSLPPGLPMAMVVAQHISKGFAPNLAQSLDACSTLRVVVAREGERLKPGTVYLAPGGCHTVLSRWRLTLEPVGRGNGEVSPSADRLFASGASLGARAMGIVLTGMGNDGAEGLRVLREAGVHTVAESPETAIIYGMPRAALESGAAEREVPLDGMAREIVGWIGGGVG